MHFKVITESVLTITAFAGIFWATSHGTSHKEDDFDSIEYVAPAPVDSSAINWEKMDRSERMAHMKQVVFPAMKTAFQTVDPKKYANMKCVTCHGAGAKDDSYKMPNPQLMKLPRSKEGWDKIMTEKADMLKFMKEHVKPDMAKLLGMKPFDMKTKTGFGCGNCHTDEE